MVILSLISFLSMILVTGSPFKSYTNLFENNNHILLKIPPIYAQDNGGDFEGGDIFPDFEEDNGGVEKDGGSKERINENTNDFSPLSSGLPTNTDDKANPDDEVGQPVDQQSEQEAEDAVQVDQQTVQDTGQVAFEAEVDQQTGQQVEQQTVGNEVNLTEQQQDTGEQGDQQTGQQVEQQDN